MKQICCLILILIILSTLSYAFLDSDVDGVPDSEDKCNDSETTIVNANGCSCEQKNDMECSTKYPKSVCCNENETCIEVDFKAKCVLELAEEEEVLDILDDEEQLAPPETVIANIVTEWSYEEGVIIIQYPHSEHHIQINFAKTVDPSDITVIETTSLLLNQEWNSNQDLLSLTLEGNPNEQGITKIRSPLKPFAVKIDGTTIREVGAKFPSWVVGLLILVVLLLAAALLTQRRKSNLEELLELKTYIIDSVNKGYTHHQIKEGLLKDGWDKQLVDKAFNNFVQPKKATPMQLVEMQNYITLNLRKGFHKHQIKEALLKDGWPESEVEQAFKNLGM